MAIIRRLLIHQCGESSPEWRRSTGAADILFLIVVGYNVNVVRCQRDIGSITSGRRASVGRHIDIRLPSRNLVKGADAATAAFRPSIGSARTPIPNGLRCPNPIRTGRRQSCATHECDIWAVRLLLVGQTPVERIIIARGLEK